VAEALREWVADNNVDGQDGSMYADMIRRQTQKDVDKRKKEKKAALVHAADSETKPEAMLDPEEQEIIRKRQVPF
jgi:hypothetical protein